MRKKGELILLVLSEIQKTRNCSKTLLKIKNLVENAKISLKNRKGIKSLLI